MKLFLIAAALTAMSFDAAASFACVQVQYSPSRADTRFDEISWTVGYPVPQMPGFLIDSWTVELACAASGSELDYIRAKFTGLPMVVSVAVRGVQTLVVWSGDDARFLIENI